MPKRRDLISMTAPEMWDFIDSRKSIQVATINKDGSPHLTTLWFAVQDGKIVLETFTKAQKVVNLERDSRIALLFESGEVYNELKGVSINATAELVRDVDAVHRLHTAVLVRNQPEVPEDVLDKVSASMAHKKTAILVKPEKVMSWDHSKLDGIY
jgi:PPOX class probable F420-dependent enzyme